MRSSTPLYVSDRFFFLDTLSYKIKQVLKISHKICNKSIGKVSVIKNRLTINLDIFLSNDILITKRCGGI